jgi:hypothetical protein
MKNTKVRKLGLRSEVVRAMSGAALTAVIGGLKKLPTWEPNITDNPPCRDVPTPSGDC